MLQPFYKETLQSQYIKYILNNQYIPTVPFTSNIMHITKGNTYIHNGYFVTAKVSDAIAAVDEDITQDSRNYSKYFIKHEPYVFGRFYNGLTTKYKSNTMGYDPETHYYLGEYLRAYKAHYGINLMPFYNCYSNEYIDYVTLVDEEISGKITKRINFKNKSSTSRYNILSIPIKFCQTYTIALQCNSEVKMLPVFIDKKGILEEKTKELNQLDYWGKSFPKINFNSPIYFESPHINGVNDTIQSSLQTYDKYLKLLIQLPQGVETSVVVLEGKYSNCKPYQEKKFNTSQIDVENTWMQEYNTKIPIQEFDSNNNENRINIPPQSTIVCEDISRQKIYKYTNNNILNILDQGGNIKNTYKFTISSNDNDCINELNPNNQLIKSNYPYSNNDSTQEEIHEYKIPVSFLCQNFNETDAGYTGFVNNLNNENISIFINDTKYENESILKTNSQGNIILKKSGGEIFWKDIIVKAEAGNENAKAIFEVMDSNSKKIRGIIAVKGEKIEDESEEYSFKLYAYEYAFYLDSQEKIDLIQLEISDTSSNASSTPLNNLIINNNIFIDLKSYNNNPTYYIQMVNTYPIESSLVWELNSVMSVNSNTFSNYLNQVMISNLSLLDFNNKTSYAFCDRLIEYLTTAVITSNEKIPKNILRVQSMIDSIDLKNDIYTNKLRLETYNKIKNICKENNLNIPKDINGFVDKDSEKLLSIPNEIN